MYSLPMRTTLAALTIASAASIAPIKPRVSISPSASDIEMVRAENAARLAYGTACSNTVLCPACEHLDPTHHLGPRCTDGRRVAGWLLESRQRAAGRHGVIHGQ